VFEQVLNQSSSIWERDGARVRRIEEAADLAALIELAPIAGGLAEYPWLKRMRRSARALSLRLSLGCAAIGCARMLKIEERLIGC
jgi:hypothetical protein